ncbi:1-acyl-sn-glycerol-3-phosphate acyltransferase [candidate division KSB1 bacterium]|nr:1-acyl-sn-glycerol-3-phosphate acyltransferase [candidate division KSB1 bacterium]
MPHTDLTFITNEEQKNLKSRFQALIKDTKLFDCLVGYFYTSGFHAIYKSLENTEKIRILIGISTSKQTYELLSEANNDKQQALQFSHAETKQEYEELVEQEMENSEDKREVEEGVVKFIEWIKNNKLEVKAYPSKNIHAKLYIMTFAKDDRDVGRVITGSSNFTYSGLVENLEFNVELKNHSDYKFAKDKFEDLWKNAVDVSEKYIQTIQEKTWLNPDITPYQLYLKFLYEYFKDELSQTDEMFSKYFPQEFKKLKYQEEAVYDAKRKLEEYGGVFISDVVGLGKTYISAMLAGQIDGRTLVIAPPILLDKTNPGSWLNVFSDFRVQADFESIGKLDQILRRGTEKYKNIIIDEPFIIACNHASYLDDFAVPRAFYPPIDRKFHFYVNSLYFKNILFRIFLNLYESIPVDTKKGKNHKQVNRKAIDMAMKYLKKGDIIFIFPEGARSLDGKLQKGKVGIAKLALEARVPVQPVGIIGSNKILPKGKFLPRPKRCKINIGEALYFKEYYNKTITKKLLREVTNKIMREIAKLIGQKYNY